jgi:catechol 2,3-dioxygenase-like lactoylglutathione lyase family enzyme
VDLNEKIADRGRRLPYNQAAMAVTGAHVLLYTAEPEALREIFRDVFGFEHVDAGEGWLIFALPPAELGIHPAEGPTFESGVRHQLTFMCDDIARTVEELRGKGVHVGGETLDEGWGITTTLVLPGGVDIMLYEPRHPTAI